MSITDRRADIKGVCLLTTHKSQIKSSSWFSHRSLFFLFLIIKLRTNYNIFFQDDDLVELAESQDIQIITDSPRINLFGTTERAPTDSLQRSDSDSTTPRLEIDESPMEGISNLITMDSLGL